MWLFNAPPTAQVKTKHGFDLTPEWLEHLEHSSVRFDNGGSGAFVSSKGLVVTNQHIASDCLHALSDAQHDYVANGFYARKQNQELSCPNLELNVLEKITDVTGPVSSAAKPGMSDAQAGQAQRAAMAAIEKQCASGPTIRCDVVTLYSGAKFHLYEYRRYTDVRLVFAPEFKIAFFGGDADNFEFPRYDLDVAFFRVYEGGKPVDSKDCLHWSRDGATSGDLVFVSGHPGSTARGETLNQIYFEKNTRIPWLLADYRRRITLLESFAKQSGENARIAHQALSNLENNLKRYQGYLAGLDDPGLMNRKKGDERRVLVFSRRGPRGRGVIPAMQQIDHALETYHKIFPSYILLAPVGYRDTGAFRGRLAAYAMTLVQAAEEKQKPNGERLREYRDSALPSLEQNVLSRAPVYKSLETTELADSVAEMQKELGDENAVVKAVLKGRAPQEVAQNLIEKTKLADVADRQQLYTGGEAAIAASSDPLIAMFRDINPQLLAIRKQYEDEVESVVRRNRAVIEEFRFAFGGMNAPPDATFTLRLSYGHVSGYVEDGRGIVPKGTNVSPFTDIAGAFAHAAEQNNQGDYELPETWRRAKKHLDLKTPLNFVSTADIIGGSSGSPVVNKQGELVGIVFDGNIQSLPWDFLYDDRQGRAISVDSRAVNETLRKIYHAGALADELKRGR